MVMSGLKEEGCLSIFIYIYFGCLVLVFRFASFLVLIFAFDILCFPLILILVDTLRFSKKKKKKKIECFKKSKNLLCLLFTTTSFFLKHFFNPFTPSLNDMTTLYHHIIFLLCMVPINLTATTTATSALRTNPINLSTITQFNLTSSTYTTFFLPSSQYTSNKTSLTPPIDTIYITLSLCSPPNSLIKILPNNLPSSLYLTNSSSFTFNDQKPFLSLTYGFSNFTIDLKGGNNAKGDIIGINDEIKQQGIYIGILSPNLTLLGGTTPTSSSSSLSSSSTEVWNWELTISTNLDNPSNSDGGITILDNSPSFKYEDSDNTTALITSTNYTDPTSLSFFNQGDDTLKPNWKPLIKLTTPLSIALSNSFCAITTTTDVPQVVEVEESVTTRGYGGGERLQFLLKGLESGRNYTVWLVEEFNVGTTTGGVVVVGRRLLEPIYFKTKLG